MLRHFRKLYNVRHFHRRVLCLNQVLLNDWRRSPQHGRRKSCCPSYKYRTTQQPAVTGLPVDRDATWVFLLSGNCMTETGPPEIGDIISHTAQGGPGLFSRQRGYARCLSQSEARSCLVHTLWLSLWPSALRTPCRHQVGRAGGWQGGRVPSARQLQTLVTSTWPPGRTSPPRQSAYTRRIPATQTAGPCPSSSPAPHPGPAPAPGGSAQAATHWQG